MNGLDGDQSQLASTYSRVKTLFDHSKCIYVDDGLFLWEDELGMTDPDSVATLRLANLASLISALIVDDSRLLGEIHDVFLDVVAPDGGEPMQVATDLLMAIKCKLVVSTLLDTVVDTSSPSADTCAAASKLRDQLLDEIMLGGSDDSLDSSVSTTDTPFLESLRARKEMLRHEIGDEDNTDHLQAKLKDCHESLLGAVAAYLEERAPFLQDEASRCGMSLPYLEQVAVLEPESKPEHGSENEPEHDSEQEHEPQPSRGQKQKQEEGMGLDAGSTGFPATDDLVEDTILNLVQDLNQHSGAFDHDAMLEEADQGASDDVEGLDELEDLVERQTKTYIQNRLNQFSPTASSAWPVAAPSPSHDGT
jgi:hypothetical protein